MPTFRLTDPATGKTVRITGDSPPTEQEAEELFGSASRETNAPASQPKPPFGPIVPGNVNLNNRPAVQNGDGYSTVRTIGVNADGRETNIPTVSDDGRLLSNQDAVANYRRTGKHLGQFGTPMAATAYAEQLHQDQARQYAGAPLAGYVDQIRAAAPTRQFTQSLTQGESNPATINPAREASMLARAGAGVKVTPEGKSSYYESLGYKTATDRDGSIFLLDKKTNEWFPSDRGDFNRNDIADFTGDAIQTIPEALMSIVGRGRPSAAAAGGAAGSALRQGVSAMLPGSDNMSLPGRAKEAATSALFAGGTQASVNAISRGVDAIRPRNVAARYVERQYAGPMARESARLENTVGQQYTPGQATGSRGLLTIEGLVRRHPASADRMAANDTRQLSNSLAYLDRVITSMSSAPASSEAVGGRVSQAFDHVVSGAVKVRREAADVDFGLVDKLAGNYRVITPKSLITEINTLTKEFDVPGGGDASSSLVERLHGIKKELTAKGVTSKLTANETKRLLQLYGDAARGTGAIFKDLDTGQQRLIARRLQNAVAADLDEAADKGGHVGKIADALKTARNNYRANSHAINQFEESVLGRLLGGKYERAPERVAQSLRNMKPTELRESFAILGRADPEIAQSVKRMFVEDALTLANRPASANVPPSQIAGETAFSAAKFLTAIRKSQVWDIVTPSERASMTNAVRDLERISFRAGTDGSPTAPLQFAWEVAKAFGGGAMALSPVQIAKTAASVIIPSRIASLITDPAGRQALRTLRTTTPGTTAYVGATTYAIGLMTSSGKADTNPDASFDAASANARMQGR